MANPFFERPIVNSPTIVHSSIGNSMLRGSRRNRLSRTGAGPSSSRPFQAEERKGSVTQQSFVFDEGKGLRLRSNNTIRQPIINEVRSHVSRLAGVAQRQRMAGDSGNGPLTAALAASPVQQASGRSSAKVEAVENSDLLTEVAPESKTASVSSTIWRQPTRMPIPNSCVSP